MKLQTLRSLRRLSSLVLAVVLFASTATSAAARPVASAAARDDEFFHPSRILVKLRDTGNSRGKFEVRNSLPGENVRDTLARVSVDPGVEFAEFDHLVRGFEVVNDTSANSQWALTAVRAYDAWDVSKGSALNRVCVLDTGINYNHPDLQGQMDPVYGKGVNFVDSAKDGMDDNGHGTSSAGIISAATNNGLGIAGLNWQASLVPCKWLASNNQGYVSNAIKCLDWCHYVARANISNNSWGTTVDSRALSTKIAEIVGKGHLMIAAAGNSMSNIDQKSTPMYPAAYTSAGIISVAATNAADQLASFSNYGPKNVDLGAPGESVLSTRLGSTYATVSGTSFAAPHVTGAALLLKARNPAASAAQIKNAILSSTRKVSSLSNKCVTGGILNIDAALAVV